MYVRKNAFRIWKKIHTVKYSEYSLMKSIWLFLFSCTRSFFSFF